MKYKQVLPFRENIRVDEQFGFKPYSVIRPDVKSKSKWSHAYLNDGDDDKRRNDTNEYLPGLKFSEFHAGIAESILRYWSLVGSVVVDPFAGRATRAIVSTELGRQYHGYEVSEKTRMRVIRHFNKNKWAIPIFHADGTKMEHTETESADLIFTCPPYYNIEKYESVDNQLSDEDTYESFMDRMNTCTDNCFRVLKEGAFSVWVVGDFRESGKYRMFHSDLVRSFERSGFNLHDIIIMENISPFAPLQMGKVASKRYTSKVHEYIIVMRKPGEYQVPEYCEMDVLTTRETSSKFFNL